MSFVNVVPEFLETAASDAARIGSAVQAGHLAALLPTTNVTAAAADEVSAAIAAVFSTHAQQYQQAAAQASTYYEQFVQNLGAAAASYTGAEAAIAASLQSFTDDPARAVGEAWVGSPLGRVLDPIINAPAEVLLGRDLIGDSSAVSAPAKSIVIDFVRHGQSVGNAVGLMDTAVPGTALTPLGVQQAQTIAAVLGNPNQYAGVFASQLLRTQQTAGYLTNAFTVLPGLNEIDAGVFSSLPMIPAGILYLPAPLLWTLGLPIAPMLIPGSAHFNGVVFDRGFTSALQTMYSQAMANPVVAGNGQITDVAYASEFSIEVGTLMNVNNPDPLLMLTHPLPNTGVVVVQGNPQNGWTMTSWDGVPVPPANLPTELFVDVRNLITAPQFAAYDGWQALLTGDPVTIVNSFGDGANQVANAALNFPGAVTHDVVGALGGATGSSNPIIDVAKL
ncbi:PE domain-containing protein [Mycobacterium sp. Marseille-P9652]|uniref:PE domain-containing protein n=1 Tax=Mycobacterium sp. Marseille-P9652 TaxID=2654950 RepID=UPI0012E967C6|nr:PE domain-containing protein [Mycobacterium sp. Marseille-P9652]